MVKFGMFGKQVVGPNLVKLKFVKIDLGKTGLD